MTRLPALVLLVAVLQLVARATCMLAEPAYADPELEIHERTFQSPEAWREMTIFPRRQVPQIRQITQPGALLMVVNVRELALLPGDRLVLRDSKNSSVVTVLASNQSITRQQLQQPLPTPWNRPFFFVGNRVIIEYWPSLMTLVLPIDREELDNAVVQVESLTFAIRRRRSSSAGGYRRDDLVNGPNNSESQIGDSNEMKPAVCYKNTKPKMYNKSRAVARLIIPRTPLPAASSSTRIDEITRSEQGIASTDQVWAYCTGWLVGRGSHMLTNYHCFYHLSAAARSNTPLTQSMRLRVGNMMDMSGSSSCGGSQSDGSAFSDPAVRVIHSTQTQVNFMAESKTCEDISVTGAPAGSIDASSVQIVAASQSLDYCLLRVRTNETDLAKKYGYLTLRGTGLVDGEAIYIPQHPNGEPKMIAATKDRKRAVIRVVNSTSDGYVGGVSGFDNESVFYNADTAPGSSGSPVISQRDNTVVALHRAGPSIQPPTSRGWLSILPRLVGHDDRNITQLNIGIRIDAIIEDLRKRDALPPCAVAEKCSTASTTATRSPCCSSTW